MLILQVFLVLFYDCHIIKSCDIFSTNYTIYCKFLVPYNIIPVIDSLTTDKFYFTFFVPRCNTSKLIGIN